MQSDRSQGRVVSKYLQRAGRSFDRISPSPGQPLRAFSTDSAFLFAPAMCTMRRWMFWVRGSLHWPLYINALPTFLTDERFDDGEATKHVGRSAARTPGATNLVGAKSINLTPARSVGTVSTTAPQQSQTRSATPPFATTMRQPSQSAPVATSCGTIR